ncbi:diacylglycerol kinase epsilon [Thrips palmi]|uniref:Diacylglycerol kinase n=1 Tax=Thrips palmi TaxID=161013 RepID=A0A6P8ZTU3_THRPL|nr:diacylglycerol kinase epsilon [Thrips palmi]
MWPLLVLWDAGASSVLFQVSGVIIAFTLSVSFVRFLTRDEHVPIRDASKRHNWQSSSMLNKVCYCNVCEVLLAQGEGVFCDCCGVSAHVSCVTTADGTLKCKVVHCPDVSPFKHHWVKGNLPLGATCDVCEEEAGYGCGLIDFSCCWCHRCVHAACLPILGDVCDFGRFRALIVPPNCVEVESRRSSIRRKLRLRTVKSSGWSQWTPLIVMANCRSGSNEGAQVLATFRKVLNPAQCIDLAERPPEVALEWCQLLQHAGAKPTILVAGGDGTVGWVLNAVHSQQLEPAPPVALIPLGTGNDLSRVLGWGKEFCPDLQPEEVLNRVLRANVVKLDRWEVTTKWAHQLSHIHRMKKRLMYNYMSVGVDAQVTLNFHRTRESAFYIISSRIFNKMLYLLFGTQQVMERGCRNLEERVELFMDGKRVELPEIESIVILNIPSWGAGCRLWDMLDSGEVGEQSISDGKLEVLALYSSFHMAQLQIGLSTPHLVGQASSITLKFKDSLPVQVDGEPWQQGPCTITVNCNGQATLLSLPSEN